MLRSQPADDHQRDDFDVERHGVLDLFAAALALAGIW